MFLQSLVKLNNSISVRNFAPKFRWRPKKKGFRRIVVLSQPGTSAFLLPIGYYLPKNRGGQTYFAPFRVRPEGPPPPSPQDRRLLDRQPRRFIYPKDGGRFDAPKIHVFTHLLRKCFTGKPKVRLRPPKSTIYGGSKWPLFTPKTAWIKIA